MHTQDYMEYETVWRNRRYGLCDQPSIRSTANSCNLTIWGDWLCGEQCIPWSNLAGTHVEPAEMDFTIEFSASKFHIPYMYINAHINWSVYEFSYFDRVHPLWPLVTSWWPLLYDLDLKSCPDHHNRAQRPQKPYVRHQDHENRVYMSRDTDFVIFLWGVVAPEKP